MKYIVYLTTNKINRKIYIGVHKIEDPEVWDGYLGCGCWIQKPTSYKKCETPFQRAVTKYGVKSFVRVVLKSFDDEDEAYALEELLVNEDFIRREDTYNIALGGRHGGLGWTHRRIEIYMYDLNGNFEREFESLKAASMFLGAKNTGHMTRAIRLGHQFLGHQFSYEKVPYMKKLKGRNMGKVDMPYVGKKVGRYDDDGNLLEIYETMTDCVKAGYKNAKMVATGAREHCKGYVFKYLD